MLLIIGFLIDVFKLFADSYFGHHCYLSVFSVYCLGKTTSAIVGMELKYPDDEKKKNSVCISLDIPETPEDYFIAAQSQNKVEWSTLIGRDCRDPVL